MLLTAGVDPASALTATAETASNRDARTRLRHARATVEGGQPIWQALGQEGLLTPQQVWLVRVGEESGSLATHMDTVVQQERREEMFRGRLLSAMLYPVTVLVIAAVVGLAVAWLVLPRLATVFGALHITLPLLTRALIALGVFLGTQGYWAVPSFLIVLSLIVIVLFVAPATRRSGQALLLAAPGIGRMVREIELSRFGFVVGSLLDVGVPMDQALQALEGAGSFDRYRLLYARLRDRIVGGRTIGQSLDDAPGSAGLIPATVRQVLRTAEQSGRLPEAIRQIGIAYERRLEVTSKNVIATMEPLLLFIVWIAVVLLAIAVITPIYSVLQGVHK